MLLCACTVATMHVMKVLLLWRYPTAVSVDMRRFSATGIVAGGWNPSLLLIKVPFAYQENKVLGLS